ncbi:hypothetical protein [Methylobacterium sp. 22177]|uniref:hypothetical protein n=1 Tax=Methylobacterium sp. 22177 TaxID=3453885 RepID=UPI003F840EE9
MSTGSSGRISSIALVAAALLAFASMGLLAAIWAAASPILGRLYAGVRIAESAGLWLFTGWGRYFTSVPAEKPFDFLSIYKSSLPFGLASAVGTAAIGWAAYRKVSRRHLRAVLAAPPGGFGTEAIRTALQPAFPHLIPPGRPLARSSRPEPNPFAGLRDLRDGSAVWTAMEVLPWPQAATLALATDALAPIADRTPIESVTRLVWRLVRADHPEPKPSDLTLIKDTLTQVMTELSGRDLRALDAAHACLAAASTMHDALAALTVAARDKRVFPVTAVAWLRFADPLLHERVVSAELD